ncbi:MAG TPA: hypothetical protein DDY45_03430 [Verrucomicrobiales bacterium]|jgi:endonuclease/exonuclease/phosphatase family metal-dependent hydrolase|nr:hypothetical protein [Verrucomicrobiales bacterium]
MRIRGLLRRIPPVLLLLSLSLHFFTIVLYVRLPLKLAAVTIYPVWVWGAIGLALASFCYLFSKARGSLTIILLWTFTILIVADEAGPLARLASEPMKEAAPEEHAGSQILRVITLNCAGFSDPLEATRHFDPDIIFLQEIPPGYRIKRLTDTLFKGKGDYRYNRKLRFAIIVRGTIEREFRFSKYRTQLVKAEMFDGRKLNLMNLHLLSAATNMKLHQLNCWREHIKNHTLRRIELSSSLAGLRQYGSHPRFPTIVAGDFNAPANDSVHRIMRKEFTDSFDAVGTGWGNTFHRVLPLLRIDYIYGSAKLIPVRSQTFTRHKTDHRMVVSDFIYR